MTVNSTTRRAQYDTNGTTGPWTVPFYFLANADLEVIHTDAAGVETALTLTTHYSVTGAGVPSGGAVTTVSSYASGGTITVLRSVAILQETDYVETDAFPAAAHETALDRLTMIDQQQSEEIDRALKFPASDDTSAAIPSATARASKLLGFDASGNVAVVTPASQDASALALLLASSGGSGQVGFIGAGSGAVATTTQARLRERLAVSGAVSGVTSPAAAAANVAAFTSFFSDLIAQGGGLAVIPPGDYYFGQFATSVSVVSIARLSNARIEAYGARFIVDTTANNTTPFLFNFAGCHRVVWAGGRFFDSGFDPVSWMTHGRWGMSCITVVAAVESRGLTVIDAEAENVTYFVLVNQRGAKRLQQDVTVRDCYVKNAYYGVDMIYAGGSTNVSNLRCIDVRRGFIGFGQRNTDIDIKLTVSEGFFGSNAFISLCCEGEAYDDTAVGGTGVLGADANSEGIRITLTVDGFEGHENFVHFYHQQNDSAGYIAGVKADVRVNNISATGRDAGLGDTNVYMFDHELPSTAILGATSRKFRDIELDGSITGTITGLPIVINSSNAAVPHRLALSPTMTEAARTLVILPLTGDVDFLTPFERALVGLIPVGSSSAGSPTGLVSEGTYTTQGKRVHFNAFMSWTAHTGTGDLRISGLPLPVDVVAPAGDNSAVIVNGTVAHTAGTTLFGALGGVGNAQIILYQDAAGVVSTVPIDVAVSGIYISGSYLAG